MLALLVQKYLLYEYKSTCLLLQKYKYWRLDPYLVRPYVHKILVVIEPLLIDEDYYARVEGREIIANLSKAAGLATIYIMYIWLHYLYTYYIYYIYLYYNIYYVYMATLYKYILYILYIHYVYIYMH